MRLADFDYDLPADRIAQYPLAERDASRLLVLNRRTGEIAHRLFRNLPDFLHAGDALVLNDTRVIPARLWGTKEGGGARIEILLLERLDRGRYLALANRARRLAPGMRVRIAENLVAVTRERRADGLFVFDLESPDDCDAVLARHGHMPLPPYIARDDDVSDRERYQTVYATQPGSAAAPTAGLHFTPELLQQIADNGVSIVRLTLHVGVDTFKPVTSETVEEHRMHSEWFEINPEAVTELARVRATGGRVVAVGTTSVRALESASTESGEIVPGAHRTELFIYPGYRFRVVDAMVTNFHLPRSTLLLLVSAFAGTDRLKQAYMEAISAGYRFYSYGDAMLIG